MHVYPRLLYIAVILLVIAIPLHVISAIIFPDIIIFCGIELFTVSQLVLTSFFVMSASCFVMCAHVEAWEHSLINR